MINRCIKGNTMTTKTHVYTSALPEFKSWHDWAQDSLSEAELTIYETEADSAEKLALYERWIIDQKITSHTVSEDGNEVVTTSWTPAA